MKDCFSTPAPVIAPGRLLSRGGGLESFRPAGELGDRLAHSLRHLRCDRPFDTDYFLAQIDARSEQWTNFPGYHGDTAGRYLWVQAVACSGESASPDWLSSFVRALLALQNADGSFGAVADTDRPLNMGKAYGNAWLLKGLCEYAQVFSDRDAAEGADRLAAHVRGRFADWKATSLAEDGTGFYAVSPSCYFHVLDGLVDHYRLSGCLESLETARLFPPLVVSLDAADHSHMFLTIRRGLLSLAEVTDDAELLKRTEAELELFWERWITETGAVPERLVEPSEGGTPMDEGCSLSDWVLACFSLHRLTGRTRWLERGLLTLENALFYNQLDTGGFGHRAIGGDHHPQHGKEAYWCCSYFGPTAMALSAAQLIGAKGSDLRIDHLLEGECILGSGERVVLRQDRSRGVYLVDATRAPSIETITLAQPHWLSWTTGSSVEGGVRIQLGSDRILALPLAWKVWVAPPQRSPEPLPGGKGSGQLAVFYGPWKMVSRGNGSGIPRLRLEFAGDGSLRLGSFGVDVMRGMPACAETIRLRLSADVSYSEFDLFAPLGQPDGELLLYPLKDKESPDDVSGTFPAGPPMSESREV